MKTNCTEKHEKILIWLRANMDEERYIHSLGSAQCSAELAKKFNLDEERAYIAGLLHDCAKCFDRKTTLKISKNIKLEENETINFKVLHAPVSAFVAQKEFGITDEEILSSIRWHTIGKLNMSLFEKIIFLADKIEPATRDIDFRTTILKFLEDESNIEHGLNKALFLCYKETIKSLIKRDLKICQATIDVYNSLLS